MNKLTKVLDIVREKNPETMKLNNGCLVKDPYSGDTVEFVSILSHEHLNDLYTLRNGFLHLSGNINNQDIEQFKIIGHPLYPSHLLVALGELENGFDYNLCANGWIDKWSNGKVESIVHINPTQPLEPQLQANPELLDKVYKLLIDKV